MPVIARAGQPLCRDRASFGAGTGLQEVKQRETHRLLHSGVTLDLDIGASPKIVEIRPLLGDQPVPARLNRASECGGDLIADRGLRAGRRPAVGHEFDHPQPLPGFQRRGDRDTAQIGHAFTGHLHRWRSIDVVLHGHTEPQAAEGGVVQQRCASPTAGVFLRDQWCQQRRRFPRVDATAARQRLVGHEFGLQHHPHRLIERFDVVTDGGDRTLHQRHQPARTHPYTLPTRRYPLGLTAQLPAAEIQHPLVGDKSPIADVEGLIIDQEADQLAVGHVDDGLTGLGVAVTGLGVGQRVRFVHTVQIAARQPVRLPLVKVSPPTDMTVRQGEQRLALRDHVEIEASLA